MSSYQWIEFRAIDEPVPEKHMDFMECQSSRADVSRWKFTNEYNYGDFHGDTIEMMQRGYDLHFHFASYGIRTLMIRLPAPPCRSSVLKRFLVDDEICWHKDSRGRAGVLELSPFRDDWDYLESPCDVLDDAIAIRQKLLTGDIRPLFIARLACVESAKGRLPPVPAGLNELDESLEAFLYLWEVSPESLELVHPFSDPLPNVESDKALIEKWLKKKKKAELQTIACDLLNGTGAHRVKLMTQVRTESDLDSWPTRESKLTADKLYNFENN